jgi:imidazolonepropionase-like amidohydrolase
LIRRPTLETLLVVLGTTFSLSVVADSTLIRDVSIIDVAAGQLLEHRDVLIEDGLILDISDAGELPATGARSVDGGGLFLMAGLIDSHVHLGGVPGMRGPDYRGYPEVAQAAADQEPRSYLLHGFTTVVQIDASRTFETDWIARSTRPDLIRCRALSFANGYGMAFDESESRWNSPYIYMDDETPDDLPSGIDPMRHTPEAAVAAAVADGAACIKVFHEAGFGGLWDWPTPSVDALRRVVGAAHEANLPVLLHAISLNAWRAGAAAGVDVLAHGMWSWDDLNTAPDLPLDVREVLDAVIAEGIAVQTTAQVIYSEVDLLDDPDYLQRPEVQHAVTPTLIDWYRTGGADWFRERMIGFRRDRPDVFVHYTGHEPTDDLSEASRIAIDRLRRVTNYLAEHGGRFLLASDTPSSPTYTNSPGLNGHYELARLKALGLTELQILRAATIGNAAAFSLADRGQVQVGMRADLLLLGSDPLSDIRALSDIRMILHDGTWDTPAALSADHR